MTQNDKEFAKKLVAGSSHYLCGNIDFQVFDKPDDDTEIKVWTKEAPNGGFHALSIVGAIEEYFRCYIVYNESERRCELHIF